MPARKLSKKRAGGTSLSASLSPLQVLQAEIINCVRCPRLIKHCNTVAQVKRRAYRDEAYWGRPVPSFGDPQARLLVIGLAPGAHGANRTGRMFTGDSSGEFLYRAMYEAGFASQPTSRAVDDGLELHDAWISASAHCAPPDNKPSSAEIAACRTYLKREIELLPQAQVVVALGRIAFDNYLSVLQDIGVVRSRAAFAFGHNMLHIVANDQPSLLGSYHPSQQNTSTRKLTSAMLLDVFLRARTLCR